MWNIIAKVLVVCLLATPAWADDTAGISAGSGIEPGQPWVDDGSTLFPGSDRDIDASDDTIHVTLRDSDTNTAFQLHVEDSATDPWRGLTFWQGTQTASGATFNVGTLRPSLRIDQSGGIYFNQLQTVNAARCLELAASGQMTLAAAACGTGGGGNSFETIAVPAGANVVADASTDTLTITETTFLTFTGTAATDTIDITQVTTDIGTDGLIAANAVALGTDTTNNYVATIADAGNANITVANSGSETAAVTLDVVDVTCTNCLTNVEVASADTVTTNANLTGDVTSVGNAATIADTVTVTGWVLGTSSATTFTSGTVNIDLLDGVGAVDMDYGSADITDHTFTSDGGTVILDGGVTGVAGTFSGLLTGNAHLQVGNGATTAGIIAIREDTDAGTNEATFTVPALGADTDYTVPADDGTDATTELLTTNGAGTLDWITCATLTGSADLCDGTDATGAGGGDPVLVDGIGVTDASGVDLIGGTNGIDIAFSAAASPDTATFNLDLSEIAAGDLADASVVENDLAASLAFDDGDLLDLSAINASATTEGLILPQAADTSTSTAEGQLTHETDLELVRVGTGTEASPVCGFILSVF